MIPILSSKQGRSDIVSRSQSHLDAFATSGLRSLMIGVAEISDGLAVRFMDALHQAEISITERDKLLDIAYELVERDVQLLGVTAIEDKLQDGVPETIKCLRDANVRVWMLTGDKYSTAIQIGVSCNLISSHDGEVVSMKTEDVKRDPSKAITDYSVCQEYSRSFYFLENSRTRP